MQYNNIATTLQWAEVPDLQEGLFLQPEECAAIDAALAQADNTALVSERDSLAIQVQQLTDQLATANNEKQTLTTERNTLKGKVDAFARQKSGSGTVVKTTTDPGIGGKPVPSYADDKNPSNAWVDKQLASHKAFVKNQQLAAEED